VTEATVRNKHIDVMLGIGIVFVVMGHRYQPEYLFFPAYTFHMALFFFISGSLATVRPGWREKLRLAGHKSRTQLLRYFQYNLFFAVVTWLLAQAGIPLGYNIPSFTSRAAALQSVREFFIVPFLDGHQYHLYLAAWFILQLYLVHLVFQSLVWSPRRAWVLSTLAAAIPVTLFLLKKGLSDYTDLRMTLVRTSFAFLFYLLGYVVKTEEAALRRVLLSPATLALGFVLVNVLAINFGNVRYNIVVGDIGNQRVWVPLLTTTLIVLMVYQLAWHLAAVLSDDAFLLRLGRGTLPILIWHFTVFFAINAAFFALGLITKENLSDNWFVLDGKQTWLLYEVPALCVPLWLDRVLGRFGGARALRTSGR
jgi:fucose 4-O-acetylase-like acetyltransferase